MDLFAARGIELEERRRGSGRSRGAAPRPPRVPLLKPDLVKRALGLGGFALSGEQRKAAEAYAKKARSPRFVERETAVRDIFIAEVLGTVLGYVPYDPDRPYTLARERSIRGGAVDVALGRFPGPGGEDEFVAPFELKGPKTRDLDAIEPGRGRSPERESTLFGIEQEALAARDKLDAEKRDAGTRLDFAIVLGFALQQTGFGVVLLAGLLYRNREGGEPLALPTRLPPV